MPRRPRDLGIPKNPVEYFAAELRACREAADLGRPQLAAKLGYSPQRIGQVESGTSAPSENFAKDCDTFFETKGSFHRIWEWIQDLGYLLILPPGFAEFLEREAVARVIHTFEAMAVTGLFQTQDYAYAQLKDGRTPEETEELVTTRLARQSILEGEDACHVVVVFDEYALRRPVGGPEVMRGQLQHLINLADRLNVTLQIVPSAKGSYPGVMGAFMLLGFDEGPDVAYVEGHVGGQLIERTDTVRAYARRLDLIRGAALSADESVKLLHEILEGL
ncbi:helix-turn-helix domain-containing protein [Actinomadura opuntiae]|uniref:helix-turn-helix domain-containing protein n=1 Tax=Actinomadura sp. OS1-43 TaxID=604315 RepID=UPI00255AE5ED|nr:helix-turn-helix transcriptional regulator [Actinomadura sp. OS1-43]MDL4817981.1 helix-turn-helix transcriptional regulator [Actinomadura sp. OS1-43]